MRTFLFTLVLGICLCLLPISLNAQDKAKAKTMDEQADETAAKVLASVNQQWQAQLLKDEQVAEQQKDYKAASRIVRMLAESGNADAQFRLASMYRRGDKEYSIPRDDSEAAKWFRKAAEEGDGKASIMLGYVYFHGEGVQQDYSEAMKWYRKAADQGEDVPRGLIGRTYPCAHCKPEALPPSADSYGPSVEEQELRQQELDDIHRQIHQQVEDADSQFQRDQRNYFDQKQQYIDQQQAESKTQEEHAYQQTQGERTRREAEDNDVPSSRSPPSTSGSNDYGYNGYGTGAQGWDGRTYIPVDPALTPGLTPDGYAK